MLEGAAASALKKKNEGKQGAPAEGHKAGARANLQPFFIGHNPDQLEGREIVSYLPGRNGETLKGWNLSGKGLKM